MRLKDIYQLVVEKGIEADPRGREKVLEDLSKRRKKFDKLDEEKKSEYDIERLENPYDDTRILWGGPETEVNSILAGIDIDTSELLLAERLKERGRNFDLVLGHHPLGKALARLHGVMDIQQEILFSLGVPINVAEGLMIPRIAEVERSVLPTNHNKAVDAARLLDIPLMCVHTPADNNVVQFLEGLFEKEAPKTVEAVVSVLKSVPEYFQAVKLNAGPKIILGSEDRSAGKIFVDMTGGTGGSEDAYAKLSEAGVGTIVCMHMGEKHRKEAEKCHLNVVIAGHIASDSLGMNIILDALQVKGIEVEPCAGLIRHSRL